MRILAVPGLAVILLALISCKTTKPSGTPMKKIASMLDADSIDIQVHALDLTEDMSKLSSGNDEVVGILLEEVDSLTKVKLITFSSWLFQSRNEMRRLTPVSIGSESSRRFIFVLLERDSDRSAKDLAQMVTDQYPSIRSHFEVKGNLGIESLIGDDDIIGIKPFSAPKVGEELSFRFQGIFKLDRFNYQVDIMGH